MNFMICVHISSIFMLFYIVLSLYTYANILLRILKIGPQKFTLKKKNTQQ